LILFSESSIFFLEYSCVWLFGLKLLVLRLIFTQVLLRKFYICTPYFSLNAETSPSFHRTDNLQTFTFWSA
jgi:hypothetical protein